MSDSRAISQALLAKLDEQIERAEHLLALVPPASIEWQPVASAARVCDLLGHLLECLAGVCATLYAVDPGSLAHFARLRDLRVNHCCGIEEAQERISDYKAHIKEGFAFVCDADLARSVPTFFVPEGETVMTILLGNLEHFINHKYQLFFYLKLLGVTIGTADLYRLRGQ